MSDTNDREKAKKFVQLAERRTSALLDAYRKLTNLSNHYSYKYDKKQVAAIESAIRRAHADMRAGFRKGLDAQHGRSDDRKRSKEDLNLFTFKQGGDE